jgi:hypothetical protein
MTLYYDSNTGRYPVDIDYIHAMYPEYNVYQPIPNGVFEYEQTEPPEYGENIMYVADTPALVNGAWLSQWKSIDLTKYVWDDHSQTWYFKNPLVKAIDD